jgi:8-amino-7-oxononanoate synthase
MTSLDDFACARLDRLAARSLKRTLPETDRFAATRVHRDGREMISFCCNDYLNLSHHPKVIEAAVAATERFGAGAGASRLVTGNYALYGELERRLARLKGTETACVFGSGYLTNVGVVPSLVGEHDLIVADALSHACLHAGSRLSRARLEIFRHNDLDHCREILERHRQSHEHCLILTDGVFSMDGDLAPTDALAKLAAAHDAWLMTDDAHGIGVVGNGRGSTFVGGGKADVPLQMGTLSKAVGAYGGYLCASRPVIDLIKTRARSLIYSTGLPPGVVAAAIAALEIIESEPALVALPLKKARRFARALNLQEPESCIVPLILGEAKAALTASASLAKAGYLVTAIRPPTVPEGTARLRFTFTAGHDDTDVDRLAETVSALVLAAA